MSSSPPAEEIDAINRLLWGSATCVSADIFQRWCQPFRFSNEEPTALLQEQGGPCAILTAVQAALVQFILFDLKMSLESVTGEENVNILCAALASIIQLVQPSASQNNEQHYWVVHFVSTCDLSALLHSQADGSTKVDLRKLFLQIQFCKILAANPSTSCADDIDKSSNTAEGRILSQDLYATFLSLSETYQSPMGVLCFLYSVLFTRGYKALLKDLAEDANEGSLIHAEDGNSGQALLNLLLTGAATPQLFDDTKDLGGYTLTGIQSRPMTGFLTYMEALQYADVGWYLKNPLFPLWVLGSEAHWTVLFSPEIALVQTSHGEESCFPHSNSPNATPQASSSGKIVDLNTASRLWRQMDSDGAGFVQSGEPFQNLMVAVLRREVRESELMEWKRRLDPESLGIILEKDFFHEFFAEELKQREVEVEKKLFCLYHYNGLPRSNGTTGVRYRRAQAFIADPTDLLEPSAHSLDDQNHSYFLFQKFKNSPMHRCLHTKWPTLVLKWDQDGSPPSLN